MNRILGILLILLCLGCQAASASQVRTGPPSLQPLTIRMSFLETNKKTGQSSKQLCTFKVASGCTTLIKLPGDLSLQIRGIPTRDGFVHLTCTVVSGLSTYGPVHVTWKNDQGPVTNCFYLDDLKLRVKFKTATTADVSSHGGMACGVCHGSGKCQGCQGKGHADCGTCHGAGTCVRCHGACVCPACGGTGSRWGAKCIACNGNGLCATCQGGGACMDCQGRGFVTSCAACLGTTKCPHCHGTGQVAGDDF